VRKEIMAGVSRRLKAETRAVAVWRCWDGIGRLWIVEYVTLEKLGCR
jgi:hypothetical protein